MTPSSPVDMPDSCPAGFAAGCAHAREQSPGIFDDLIDSSCAQLFQKSGGQAGTIDISQLFNHSLLKTGLEEKGVKVLNVEDGEKQNIGTQVDENASEPGADELMYEAALATNGSFCLRTSEVGKELAKSSCSGPKAPRRLRGMREKLHEAEGIQTLVGPRKI